MPKPSHLYLPRPLTVVDPDSTAVVEFLSHHVGVTLVVENGKLTIRVRAEHGHGHSTWDEHNFEVVLPTYEEEDLDDE